MAEIKTKFINDPEQVTPELLEGYVLAYPDQVKLAAENVVVRANPKSEDKVAIVTLGGSGHEPCIERLRRRRYARLLRCRRRICSSGCTASVPGFAI